METVSGAITFEDNVTAGQDLHVIATGAGSITAAAGKTLSAAEYAYITTKDGNITLNGEETAGKNLAVTSKNGNIDLKGTAYAGEVLAVMTDYEGDDTDKGNISLGEIPVNPDIAVSAGDDVVLQTKNGAIYGGATVTAGKNVHAETVQGDIGLLGDVSAGISVEAKTGQKGLITFGNVAAVQNIKAETTTGNIEFSWNNLAKHQGSSPFVGK